MNTHTITQPQDLRTMTAADHEIAAFQALEDSLDRIDAVYATRSPELLGWVLTNEINEFVLIAAVRQMGVPQEALLDARHSECVAVADMAQERCQRAGYLNVLVD